jgi:RTX calcium-binding nonapeptide repeat (4 copies)
MPSRRHPWAAVSFFVVLTTLTFAHSARAATTWIWPSASCSSTLTACVAGAASGDTVLVATNNTVVEQVPIKDKSLTLSAQTGFSPTINSLYIQNNVSTPPTVSLSNLAFTGSVIIEAYNGPGGKYSFDHISAVGSGADPGLYGIIDASSTVNVTRSSFSQSGFYPGIELAGNGAGNPNLTANIVGNYVSGAGATMSEAGIQIDVTDARAVTVNVYNNAIWNVGQGGGQGGIKLAARDSLNTMFNIVGNTIARVTGDGILIDDTQDAPNKFALDLYNNIVTNTTGAAVNATADEPSTFVLSSGSNDFYLNHAPNHTLGDSLGSNLAVQPKYTDLATGNLTLRSISPVIDKGVVCPPGGTADPDAAGNHRLAGPSVDIGAYERGAVAPTGVVLLGTNGIDSLNGTSGADILCGYGGNDTLRGGGGTDYLDGGTGNDKMYVTGGPSRLYGQAGNDLLCAANGVAGDYLNGGKGKDSYRADSGDTKVSLELLGNCT